MKQVPRLHRESFDPLRLYHDDLVEIWGVLTEFGEATAKMPGYEFDSPDALREHSKSSVLHDLELVGREGDSVRVVDRGYVSVTLSPTQAYVYANNDGAVILGVCHKIALILKRGQLRFGKHPGPFLSWAPLYVAIGLGWIVPRSFLRPGLSIALALVAFVISGALAARSFVIKSRRYSTVVLLNRREAPSFWERNRDELVIRSAALLVGAVLGIAGTLVVQALTKSASHRPSPSTTSGRPAPTTGP